MRDATDIPAYEHFGIRAFFRKIGLSQFSTGLADKGVRVIECAYCLFHHNSLDQAAARKQLRGCKPLSVGSFLTVILAVSTYQNMDEDGYGSGQLGKVRRFSLHAGLAVTTRERKKLEGIGRNISRHALSEARLELTDQGMVSYALQTAYRDGTTHWVFEPLDFMAKLATLVPKPRTNLTGPPRQDFMEYWHRTVDTENESRRYVPARYNLPSLM